MNLEEYKNEDKEKLIVKIFKLWDILVPNESKEVAVSTSLILYIPSSIYRLLAHIHGSSS